MVVTDEPGPTPAKMLDIMMLVITMGGKERTNSPLKNLESSAFSVPLSSSSWGDRVVVSAVG
jgi:hypothetical protein